MSKIHILHIFKHRWALCMQFQHTLKHTLKSSLVSRQLSDCSHLDSSFCNFSWSTRCCIKNEPLKWKTGISKQYFLYHPLFSCKVMSTFSRENWKKESQINCVVTLIRKNTGKSEMSKTVLLFVCHNRLLLLNIEKPVSYTHLTLPTNHRV